MLKFFLFLCLCGKNIHVLLSRKFAILLSNAKICTSYHCYIQNNKYKLCQICTLSSHLVSHTYFFFSDKRHQNEHNLNCRNVLMSLHNELHAFLINQRVVVQRYDTFLNYNLGNGINNENLIVKGMVNQNKHFIQCNNVK